MKEKCDNKEIISELAERSDKVTFIYDPDSNHFRYLNPAFEQVWEKTRESIKKNPNILLQTVHPEDREYVMQGYSALDTKNHGKKFEFRIQILNEKARWIRLTPLLIRKADDLVICGFAENITISKEHNNTLHKFAAKKNSILEILSHDLAGPLTKIKGISSILTERLKTYNDPELQGLVEKIAETNERSIQLIRELIKQEFLESANSDLIRKRVDILEVIREVIEQYKASEKDIQKTFKLRSSRKEIYVDVDDFKFSQVINNLISNSIKFTHDGGTISIAIEEKKESILITVADDGIGIPEHLHDGLFEKFTKARRPGIRGEPSVGLGMSIIKTIVEWHNGKIWFESQENKGSTFYIELPNNPSN